ncbi:MAG: response regulator transcription factor [Calditrichia bacterium]|nr:response regulator transcription factor [Calditrichia bacterium]
MLAAGATGYLLKKTPPAKLLEAISEVYQGGLPMSGQIARKVVQTFQKTPSAPAVNLSKREEEILSCLTKGYLYKEIAEQLNISVETVRTHLRNIYEKLHVRTRTEAVLKYLGK